VRARVAGREQQKAANGPPLTGEARTEESNALGTTVARASSGAAASLDG